MSVLVWVMMGIAIWHFTVFVPDRFWGGIVGAFLGALFGAVIIGLAVNGFTVPGQDDTSLTSPNLYWRLRAAFYHVVPGVVRFYDTNSLPRLVEDQGLTVVECNGEPGRVSVLARA